MTLPAHEAEPFIDDDEHDEESDEGEVFEPMTIPESNKSKAMRHLAQLVGTSSRAYRKDIKRIRKAETLNGAREWANKHSTSKRKYKAKEEDVDHDGIKDVLVRTADGELVIVNGYTVRKSDYPYRQAFGNQPDDVRKKYGNYKRYLTEELYGAPTRDPDTGRIVYPKLNPDEDPMYIKLRAKQFRTFKPREKTPYQLFTTIIVKSQIDEFFDKFADDFRIGTIRGPDGSERPRFPNVLLSVAADAWNYGVIRPILQEEFKVSIPSNISINELKDRCNQPNVVAFKKTTAFKNLSREIVEAYLKEDYDRNGVFLNKYLTPLNKRIHRTAESLARPTGE